MAPMTPLWNPRGYFARHDRPSLTVAGGIVVVLAILTGIGIDFFVGRIVDRADLTPREAAAVNEQLGGYILLFSVSVIVGWLLIGAVMHVLLLLSDADGVVGNTFAIVGESLLVAVVLFPAVLLGLLLLANQAPTDLYVLADWVSESPRRKSDLLVLLGLVSAAWQAWIQTHGFTTVHKISTGRAVVIAFGVGFVAWALAPA